MIKKILNNNRELIRYVALSYFDKAIIFLVPLTVLFLFKEKAVYVELEYIYSIVIVCVPVLGLGLPGYFFFNYRKVKFKREAIIKIMRSFHVLYICLFVLGLLVIFVHYIVYSFEKHIFLIVARTLFILTVTFLSSFYRLIDKAHKALFITLASNFGSLLLLLFFYFLDIDFELWIVFIGQILFVSFYFIKISFRVIYKYKTYLINTISNSLKNSILFSWPSIIQVFIMMLIANYGKINAIDNMSLNNGVLLSFVMRVSMVIQLSHSAVLAFLSKEIYISEGLRVISKKSLYKYLSFLFVPIVLVCFLLYVSLYFDKTVYDTDALMYVVISIVLYTVIWCIYSYFEMYFSRENKNIIKLYLALGNGIIFITLLNILPWSFLERITFTMFISTSITLLISLYILKKRDYILK
jgi:hypothetical protein